MQTLCIFVAMSRRARCWQLLDIYKQSEVAAVCPTQPALPRTVRSRIIVSRFLWICIQHFNLRSEFKISWLLKINPRLSKSLKIILSIYVFERIENVTSERFCSHFELCSKSPKWKKKPHGRGQWHKSWHGVPCQ